MGHIIIMAFQPEVIHGIYGINYYFHKKDAAPQRIQFEATVQYCGQNEKKHHVYRFSKKEFVINLNKADEYLYDIAKKCADIIFPITVSLDQYGQFVSVETDDIARRWSEKRPELERHYKGETAEHYLNKVEETINDTSRMNQLIRNDLFFSQLFATHYQHTADLTKYENEIQLIPFSRPLQFSSTQEIDMENVSNPKYATIDIIHKGRTKNPYKYGEFYKNSSALNESQYNALLSATYCLRHRLGKEKYDLEAIEGDFVISKEEEELSSVRIETYKLNERVLKYGFYKEFEKREREE